MRELDELGERFWAWRARQQPRTRDDIPRLDRPPGWLPEVDAGLADRRREELGAFEAELARIDPDEVPDRVDHRLLSSAMARVRWESDVLRVRGIPRFWTDQALGPVYDALLRPGVDADRVAEVTRLLRAVPDTLSHAAGALVSPAREFARLAVAELDGVAGRIDACTEALARIDPSAAAELASAGAEAGAALEQFGAGLADRLADLPPAVPVGRRAVRVVPARGRLRSADRRGDRGHRAPRVRARRLARAAARHPQPGRAGAAAARRRGPAGPRAGARRGGGAPVLRLPGPAEPAGVAAALPHPAHARLPGPADLPRRGGRAHRAGPAHRGRRRVRAAARPGPAVLPRRQRPRPARRDRARGGALPAARPGLAEPAPGPPALLRLRRQRGHRLLQRGDDAGQRPGRRRAAHPSGAVQLHAAARAAGDGRRGPGDRAHVDRGGSRRAGVPGPDGRRHRPGGGRVLRRDAGPGTHLPDRQDPADRPDRGRGAASPRPGPAAPARRDLGQRQRPRRPAALGTARPDRRAARPRHDPG